MDQMRAVIFFPDDDSDEDSAPPLMLEAVLFCPILTWVSKKLQADGVGRFFVVCPPRFAEAARACFSPEAEVIVSEQHWELLDFVSGPGEVTVIPRPVIPAEGAGEGYVYKADGSTLQSAWENGGTNNVRLAESCPGWLPLYRREDLHQVQMEMNRRIVAGHIRRGVNILDAATVYIDPRVEIGTGTLLLPGSILRGESKIGRNCTIGPNAMVTECTVGDESEVNASQINESTVGRRTHIGPFAYVRPGCTIGDDIKVGDFVEVKNSVLGNGTKISHLTYVGDSDVGERVNFGCGTVTTNYDGFHKFRCTIGNDVFLGCNTNLVAPVALGDGCYVAAGATITQDVPADSLAIARSPQTIKEGWAARNRSMKEQRKKK